MWATGKEQVLRRRVDASRTVRQAFDRYVKEKSPSKGGARWEIIRLRKFNTYELADMILADVQTEGINHWKEGLLTEVKPSSVNRDIALMQAVFETCRKILKYWRKGPICWSEK